MEFNNLNSARVSSNQRVVIPMNSKINDTKKDKNFSYLVKKGDTLESIAKVYKVSVEDIQIQNKLKSTSLKVGARLKL